MLIMPPSSASLPPKLSRTLQVRAQVKAWFVMYIHTVHGSREQARAAAALP